ncbi:MAG TPA: aldolase/citrate lyase family protein [Afifellaceae bacterium]|nr:aldolase/citrate lyase family protein [Afifellaceae bacterium]
MSLPARAARNSLTDAFKSGEAVFTAWSGIPNPYVAETCARADFDAVTLDMQHGSHTTASVTDGIGAIRLAGKPAIVRVPVGRFDMASRALDMGAAAVIAPMINSVVDARAFAEAMKYPPLGGRSWGPYRAIPLGGYQSSQAYLEAANTDTMSFAMIETHQAVEALDEILTIDGIDGIFVGPSDFSIAWSNGKTVDPLLGDMMDAIGDIAGKTMEAGKVAAMFTFDPSYVPQYFGFGYRLFALATDSHYLASGAASLVDSAKSALSNS